jgi:hypothetical protein
MGPTQAVEVQQDPLTVLELQLCVPVGIDELLDPENGIHLRRLGVRSARSALQERYV